jgi:ABC-type amino acid transport substrate-binding protein
MRRGVSRGLFVATVVIVAVIMLAAGLYVGKTVLGSTSSSAKPFVVGTNVPFPPFEDYNLTTKTYFGFDIQFAGMIAQAMHRPLLITNYADFSALLTDAGVGVFDMAASAITESGSVGAGRNLSMTFSVPYYEANQALLVRSASSITCAASGCTVAVMASLKIGLQSGTSSEDWADAYLKPNETTGTITEFTSVDTEVTALEAGALDAVMIDTGPAASLAAGSGGALRVAGIIHTGELYGFAVAHGDPNDYIPVINGVIYTAMRNGTYQSMITYWGLG